MNFTNKLFLSINITLVLFLLYLVTVAKDLYPLYECFVLDGYQYVGETYAKYYRGYIVLVFGSLLILVSCMLFSELAEEKRRVIDSEYEH
ncbi:hypothetical protein SAMN02745781_01307 [Vibrio gazogenes DSM 21264]|uniref:Uncharacterized protein n=1 Tax=Vibrio gazogenes DSM 21264 = NBRC 103151 TaxID=1123492 RepID=A0A1M4YG53_VIBGA|nr:hypothetical protein SAMN02745781_01307 [Vibrio gazogenes DSM 21264] [Vibrio gazogenes DSM 21264 = NBRC 103151]SJN55841.1 hypothetical protein BQ6471_01746 [Vibrio gazogenes]